MKTQRMILGAAILLTACASSPNYWVAYAPIRATTAQTRPAAVQRAVIAITDANREVESSDATTGIVMSRWFSGDGFGQDQTRFRIRVVFDEASGYEIAALCQRKATGVTAGGAWDDGCTSEPGRPRFIVDTLARIDVALR